MFKHRKSTVAGMFYPESCHEIKHYINHFEAALPSLNLEVIPRALIVPHAGYIYSGLTATLAYHYTASKKSTIKRIVVIGPSHRVYHRGASIGLYDAMNTPCGDLLIDLEFSHTLHKKFSFLTFAPAMHEEHSTEVQMPLIRHYFKHAKVVEIVYGDLSSQTLCELIDYLLEDQTTLVVISTDLSHFYTQEEANALDEHCIEAIKNLDENGLKQGCEACGLVGIKALVQSAKSHAFKTYFLDYRTSYERTKDANRVVGYASFVLG